MSRRALTSSLAALLLLAATASCRKSAPATSPEVVVVERPALTLDPFDRAWASLPTHLAPLLLQDLVDPRQLAATTGEVRVQAMSDGRQVAFRLSWRDTTKSDLPGASRFSDACAVQLPRARSADLPAPQMGEAGRPVEIAFWRASWQAVVDGRGDAIADLYPNATIDHYPFEAAALTAGSAAAEEAKRRYAPARQLGNEMAGPRTSPVQALVAEGPGSLAPDPAGRVAGHGAYRDGEWAVVIARSMPAAVAGVPLSAAFAVWEGAHEEAGARKMRTGWVPVVVRGAER